MSIEHSPAKGRRLRRTEASAYLKDTWGIDVAPKTLAKLACIGGGPVMEYVGRLPTYPLDGLDDYARAKIGPRVASTSQRQQQIAA